VNVDGYILYMEAESSDSAIKPKYSYLNARKSALIKVSLILLVLVAVSLAWRYTAVNEWVNFRTIIAWQASVKNHPLAFLMVVAVYLAASLVFFPVSIVNIATIFTFGPIVGNAYSFIGWLCAAAMGYGIGTALGQRVFHKTAGPRLERYLRSDKHGFFTVLTIRLVPVAPFNVVNMFIGASSIRFRDFLAGSAVGKIPGMIILGLAGVQIEGILSKPAVADVILLTSALIILPLAVSLVCKRFFSRIELPRHSIKLLPKPMQLAARSRDS
jgi:phospholipase D1/2